VRPILGWSALGLGAGGIAAGAVTGLMATDQFNAAGCDGSGQCPAGTSSDTLGGINSLRTASTVAFVVGGVLAAGGITLLLLPPKKSNVAYVTPYVGTTTLGLTGKF